MALHSADHLVDMWGLSLVVSWADSLVDLMAGNSDDSAVAHWVVVKAVQMVCRMDGESAGLRDVATVVLKVCSLVEDLVYSKAVKWVGETVEHLVGRWVHNSADSFLQGRFCLRPTEIYLT